MSACTRSSGVFTRCTLACVLDLATSVNVRDQFLDLLISPCSRTSRCLPSTSNLLERCLLLLPSTTLTSLRLFLSLPETTWLLICALIHRQDSASTCVNTPCLPPLLLLPSFLPAQASSPPVPRFLSRATTHLIAMVSCHQWLTPTQVFPLLFLLSHSTALASLPFWSSHLPCQ